MNLNTEKARAGWIFNVAIIANLGYQIVVSMLILSLKIDLKTNFTAFILAQMFLPLVVFGAVCLYLKSKGGPTPQSVLSLRKPKLSDMIIAGVLGIAVCFASGLLNNLFTLLMNLIGIPAELVFPEIPGAFGIILFIIALCLLPAFSEEFIYRGAITSHLTTLGTLKACLISGALFALAHMNLAQMLNAFLVGMLLTLVTLRTGSIFPAVVLHMVNNITTVVLDLVLTAIAPETLFAGFTLFEIIAAGISLIPIVFAVIYYARKNTQCKLDYGENAAIEKGNGKELALALVPGILAAIIFTVLQFL